MKKFLIVAVLFFVIGCQTNKYEHIKYSEYTGKQLESWSLDVSKAMSSTTITDVNLYLSDGSRISIKKSVVVYDGNDWIKMGQGARASGLPYIFVPR